MFFQGQENNSSAAQYTLYIEQWKMFWPSFIIHILYKNQLVIAPSCEDVIYDAGLNRCIKYFFFKAAWSDYWPLEGRAERFSIQWAVWFLFGLWVDNNINELLNHVLCIISENNVDFNCSTWLLSAGFSRHVPPDLMHSTWEKLHTKINKLQ